MIPEDGQWGAEINETGNWTGIVGNLQHKVRLSKFLSRASRKGIIESYLQITDCTTLINMIKAISEWMIR